MTARRYCCSFDHIQGLRPSLFYTSMTHCQPRGQRFSSRGRSRKFVVDQSRRSVDLGGLFYALSTELRHHEREFAQRETEKGQASCAARVYGDICKKILEIENANQRGKDAQMGCASCEKRRCGQRTTSAGHIYPANGGFRYRVSCLSRRPAA